MLKGINVLGVSDVERMFAENQANMARGVERGLVNGGKFLIKISNQLVPKQTGHLASTGNVRLVGRGIVAFVIVSYGTDYGVYVHEDLTKAHGAEFNLKYADKIADWKDRQKRRRKKGLETGKAVDPYFERDPLQQAKFLEMPARVYADKIGWFVRLDVIQGLRSMGIGRAKKGGEFGQSGKWYKGGQYMK